jgi:trans-2,3-dihydro-3-hydroxyanthranilate isomerase
MAHYEFVTLDVFTRERFGGNPLAVLPDARGLDDAQMQTIAREFNLSETTFVLPPEDGGDALVRIFTPARELPFAGHPTVGTAIVLAEQDQGKGAFVRELVLEEEAGSVPVTVARPDDGLASAIFTTPLPPVTMACDVPPKAVADAVSVPIGKTGLEGHAIGAATAGAPFIFVPVSDIKTLADAGPDLAAWKRAEMPEGLVGVAIYTRNKNADGNPWRVRMFAPEQGILEDPATGGMAAAFPAQIAACEVLTDGNHDWLVEQGVEMGRPSQIHLSAEVRGGEITAARVGGSAVRVSSGILEV